jgi:hypothetical protein
MYFERRYHLGVKGLSWEILFKTILQHLQAYTLHVILSLLMLAWVLNILVGVW